MVEQLRHQKDGKKDSRSMRGLQLTKIFLLLLILGISVVGKRESTWPITTWILYSGHSARFRPPEPTTSAVQIRVYTTSDELYIVKPEQILSIPYDSLSHSIVEQAFIGSNIRVRDESRKYLIKALSDFIPTDSTIKTVEAWELSYQVEALAVPPVRLENPTSEVMLNRFSVEEIPTQD